jgi:hypothetical protein
MYEWSSLEKGAESVVLACGGLEMLLGFLILALLGATQVYSHVPMETTLALVLGQSD